MKKKLGIIILSIILVILIVLLIFNDNKKIKNNDKIYTCSSSDEVVDVTINTTYDIYYEEDKINKININKKYKGTTTKSKENIANYRYIIGTENNQYSEIKGFNYKINKDTVKEYNYTYIFDLNKIEDESIMSMFGIFKTLTEQKEYFNNSNIYTCNDKE